MELTQAEESVLEVSSPAFTLDGYRELLSAFKDRGYGFTTFPESARMQGGAQPFVLMRHDLDFDLAAAEKIAQVEADEGVTASYFVLLRTGLYNPFSAEGTSALRQILDLGHQLGLHFDCAAYQPEFTVGDLAAASDREASILEQWFEQKVEVISYHRPSKIVLSGDPALSDPRIHTYMREFTQAVEYVSDSRGAWMYGSPLETEAFREGRPLHVLTHPIWWTHATPSPYHTLLEYRDRRIEELETAIARSCKVYRRGRFADLMD